MKMLAVKTLAVSRCRCGTFTLLEVAAVFSTMSLVTSLLVVTLLSIMRIEEADATYYNRMMNHDRTADRFRTDVGQALAAPPAWENFQAGKHCLILEHEGGVHIVYQWDKEKLQRWQFKENDRPLRPEPLPVEADGVEFLRSSPGLCTMRMAYHSGQVDLSRENASEFVAALGGERR